MTTKQEDVYNRAISLFKVESDTKKMLIRNLINITYDIDHLDYTDVMIKELVNDTIYDEDLFKKCIVPPFSVLNTQQGAWRERKDIFDAYLGDSTAGRKQNLTYSESLRYGEKDSGTSRFDSVLSEICLKWFGIEGGTVYDMFAGGNVRGAITSLCGYKYIGIDLNGEQIEANIRRNDALKLPNIEWHTDDALNADKYVDDGSVDLLFTCPPYGDLEQYTDDPRDLSNMNYDEFIKVYDRIIETACKKLKDNRFAVIVVGDFRDKEGFYRGFVRDTVTSFEKAGMKLYNELILLNSITSAAMRASAAFKNRKMIKIHQNVLVFFKGDLKTIQSNYKKIDSSIPIRQPEQKTFF